MGLYSSQASGSLWVRGRKPCLALSSVVLVEILKSQVHSIDMVVTSYNDSEEKTKSFNLKVQKEGTTIKETIYAKLGTINTGISINETVSTIQVELINNENYDLVVDFARLNF